MEDNQNGVPTPQDVNVPTPATPAPQPTPDNHQEPAPQPAPEGNPDGQPMFGIDADGNITFSDAFFGGGDEPTDEPSDVPEPPQDDQQPEPTPQTDMQTVRVDGQDVQVSMDEMRNGYMRQADYTRKTQELAHQRQQLEQQRQMLMQQMANNPQSQMNQPQQPQMTPEQQQQKAMADQRAYLDQVDAYCKDRVKKLFGEDFDEYNSKHMAAYVNEVGNVKAATLQRVNEMKQQEANKAAAAQRIEAVAAKYRQDPNFDAINQLALNSLQDLPYKMYVEVQDALKTGNAQVLDNYMQAVSNMYYRRGNQPQQAPQPIPQPAPRQVPQSQVRPPYVEPTNNRGTIQQAAPQMDYHALGRMTNDQQAAYVSRFAKELGV